MVQNKIPLGDEFKTKSLSLCLAWKLKFSNLYFPENITVLFFHFIVSLQMSNIQFSRGGLGRISVESLLLSIPLCFSILFFMNVHSFLPFPFLYFVVCCICLLGFTSPISQSLSNPLRFAGGLKVLMFSLLKVMLNVLEHYLTLKGYEFEMIEGDTSAKNQHES
jgi:SNF2 family DNA or RNA helicase